MRPSWPHVLRLLTHVLQSLTLVDTIKKVTVCQAVTAGKQASHVSPDAFHSSAVWSLLEHRLVFCRDQRTSHKMGFDELLRPKKEHFHLLGELDGVRTISIFVHAHGLIQTKRASQKHLPYLWGRPSLLAVHQNVSI